MSTINRRSNKKGTAIKTALLISLIISLLIITGFYFYHQKQMRTKDETIASFIQAIEKQTGELEGIRLVIGNNPRQDQYTDSRADLPMRTDCEQLEIDFRHEKGRHYHYKDLYENTILERDSVLAAYFDATNMVDSFSLQVVNLEMELADCMNKPVTEEKECILNTQAKLYDLLGDSTVVAKMRIKDNKILVEDYTINGESLGAKIITTLETKKISLGGKAPTETKTTISFSNEKVVGKPIYVSPIKMVLPIRSPYYKSFSFIGQNTNKELKGNWLERQPLQLTIGIGYQNNFRQQDFDNQQLYYPNRSAVRNFWNGFDRQIGYNISLSTPLVTWYPWAKK